MRLLEHMVLKNWSVRIGGGALVLLLVIALAAPWLGTVDPRSEERRVGKECRL